MQLAQQTLHWATVPAEVSLSLFTGLFVSLYSAVERLVMYQDQGSKAASRCILLHEFCPALHSLLEDGLKVGTVLLYFLVLNYTDASQEMKFSQISNNNSSQFILRVLERRPVWALLSCRRKSSPPSAGWRPRCGACWRPSYRPAQPRETLVIWWCFSTQSSARRRTSRNSQASS